MFWYLLVCGNNYCLPPIAMPNESTCRFMQEHYRQLDNDNVRPGNSQRCVVTRSKLP